MKNFAEINNENIVLRVLSVYESDSETEEQGKLYLNKIFGGNWVETSTDGSLRKRYAIVGGTYNSDLDCFVNPKPYNSWLMDSNGGWQAPVPVPDNFDIHFYWDEENLEWVEIPETTGQ